MVDPVDEALRVSWATVAWSLAAGIAALSVGVLDGALSLGGLGASVLIDVVSSAVLIWRFRHQRKHDAFPERAERGAQRVAATGLLAIAVVLIAGGADHLAQRSRPDASGLAMLLAGINVAVLPLLGRWKYGVAHRVASLALRTDAIITLIGSATALISLISLVLTREAGWWWADSVAAIAIALVAADQGRRALSVSPPQDELQG
jgi:divalent metal cation (Fe/Co/Zn/Cd) transporter